MKHFLSLLATAVLTCTLGSVPLRADTCDGINKLGDNWHGVAEYIEKHSDDGKLRKTEAAKVRENVHQLMPSTKAMAKVLMEEFSSKNKDEARAKSLGKQLQANIEELSALGEGDDWDDVGAIVDKIGDILNKVGDLCSDGK
jgi:hypothetical protein